jgi:hypothetical protein
VRHKKNNLTALLIVVALSVAAISRPALAVDSMTGDTNRLGISSTAPMSESPRFDNNRTVVPGPPVKPNAVSRPDSWPGGVVPGNPTVTQSTAVVAAPGSPVEFFEGTKILARVGSEAIFAYEVMGAVNEVLDKYKDKIPDDKIDVQRDALIKQYLLIPIQTIYLDDGKHNCRVSRIQSKLIFLEAKKSFPPDRLPEIEKQIIKHFDSAALPSMLKRSGLASAKDLDQKLRGAGSSLDREKKAFIEQTLVREWLRRQIKIDEEITYDQMVKYYHDHLTDFEKPAQAKWEEIMVQFSKFPGKAEAQQEIARLGNLLLTGAPFDEVAKNCSHGVTAAQGGQWDWTTRGNLKYQEIDQAIFGLPVGQLSRIIETEKGYHVIRVTERIETEVTPFLTAQVDIKEKISQERTNKQLQDYLDRLEDRIPVWTIYDGDQTNLRLADRLKEMR